MTKHFTSTGYLPSGSLVNRSGETFCFEQLPAFLRVLLSTDGTVTKSLESFFWEPVNVENLGQAYVDLTEDAPIIACPKGSRVLQRRVQLMGQHTKRRYVLADSLICTHMLPENVRSDLEAGVVGVGELLRECSLETYREIMDFGCDPLDGEPAVWRCYRIVMKGEPFIQITEQFPLEVYA